MKNTYKIVLFCITSAVNVSLVYADDLILYNQEVKRKPVNLGCTDSTSQDETKKPQHGARETNDGIVWRWQNKSSSWCGWMMEDVQKNYTALSNKYLEIVYSGTYAGNPSPQVKFLDTDGNNTPLKDFSAYETNIDGKKVVKIPIKDFNMGNTIDNKSVKALQFDAGWDSATGDLVIKSIKLVD